ncbi:glycosyltransferase [Gracilibacillus phocaeensis]|uniref:glycosyltransferase n=1 Tax=Gracilibacillus phocaeensis TaxID=2042304 RepID=UPI00102FE143|nr:glycosyltransferase [Gracilibacillus phocaeensis]
MDQKAIKQRLETLSKLKAKLESNINDDIKEINKKQRELGINSTIQSNTPSVSGEEVQKGDVEKKLAYLAYRDKHADVNYLSTIKPLIDQIPESNGSRFYKKLDINIGIVADEFLYNSFDGVANFHYITRENYKEYADKMDIFLLVTTWKGLDMGWKGLGNPKIRKHRRDMFNILSYYQSKGIKTIFYSKEDPVNYDIFLELAQKCDYVFTTAEEMVPNYKRDCNSDKVDVLNFGINPLYHNPIGMRKFDKKKEILFSGSWYVKYPHRIDDTQRIFDGVIDNHDKLKIIDRNYELKLERHFFPKKYVQYTSPAVDHGTLQKLHKLYDWAINLNSVKYSNTMFANRIYELQALGNILLSNYSLGVNNKFPNVFLINNRSEVMDILNGFTEEEKYQHQVYGIRRVMSHETTYKRIIEILEATNTPYPKERKSVAVLVPHKSKAVQAMFDKQSYPHKELFEVGKFTEELKEQFDMITFFDEGKEYKEFYLEDMINGFKFTDSDYITKDAYYDGDELISGIEHDYVDVIGDKTRTIFWSESFTLDELLNMNESQQRSNGYSIDHFEFNNKSLEKETVKTDYKLSVIIPTYNNGDHLLNKCFNSLKRSSIFDQMELIIVDDGSTDEHTPTIIDHLSDQYANIKTYFYHDSGSGSASRPRNKGIEIASAPYITYLDPDNEAINDGYRYLLEEIDNGNHDFVVGNMLKVADEVLNFNYYKTAMQYNNGDVIRKKNVKQYMLNTSFKAMSIQALVLKKELVTDNNLRMVEGAIGQDTLFFQELLMNAKQVKAIDLDIHIYYAAVSGSVTNVITKKFFERYLLMEQARNQFLRKQDLLAGYMEEKFYTYFKNWYLKRLSKVKDDDLAPAIDTLYKIYELYKDHIKSEENDLALFEQLYQQHDYRKIVNTFK